MKKLFAISMIALTALFGGCLTSSDNKDSESDGGGGNGGTWKVSGYVKLTKLDGAGMSGVLMKLAKTVGNSSEVFTVSTNSSGYYEFTELVNGTYTATPSKSGYTFSPASVSCIVADKDVVVQTFIGTASSSGGGGGTGSGGTHANFPLKVGATWTYDSVFDPDGLNSKSTNVEKVVGAFASGGKTYWMIESKDSGEYSYADTSLVRIDGNNVYSFMEAELFGKPAGKQARAAKMAAAARALLDSYGDEIIMIKFGLSSGQTWTIYDTNVQGVVLKIIGKSLGTESVTVPAGSYSGCAKIELTVDMKTTYDKETFTSKTVQISWFAPNVGPVKNTSVTTSSSTTDTEPWIIKTEDVLKSYVP